MKKTLVVLLVLGAIVCPRIASATAVDFGDPATAGSLAYLIDYAIDDDTDQNGGVVMVPTPGLLPNGMLDRAEAYLAMAYLRDPAKPNHDLIHTAWTANLARATTDIIVPAYRPGIAIYMTLGDPLTVQSIIGFVQSALGKVLNPADYNLTAAPFLGPDGDADGDTYTNKTEYLAATAGIDLVGPWADNATRDANRALAVTNYVPAASTTNVTTLTCTITISPNRTTVFSTQAVTFNATAAAATGAVTYQWYKGATLVHTGATYAIPSVALADAGSYTCVATDSATPMAAHDTSNAIVLTVEDGSGLPVMGMAGVALLVGLAGALGVRKIRK